VTAEPQPEFTFVVRGDPAALRRRVALAAQQLEPWNRVARVMSILAGAAMVYAGIYLEVRGYSTSWNLFYLAGGAYLLYIQTLGYQRNWDKRHNRDPLVFAETTYQARPSGWSIRSATSESTVTWSRFERVMEFRGGLLLIGTGRQTLYDLPPIVFADAAARDEALQAIRRWIAGAHSDPTR
jgi:hypothetical protein